MHTIYHGSPETNRYRSRTTRCQARTAQRWNGFQEKSPAFSWARLGSVRFGAAHPRRILSATQRTGDAHHQTRV